MADANDNGRDANGNVLDWSSYRDLLAARVRRSQEGGAGCHNRSSSVLLPSNPTQTWTSGQVCRIELEGDDTYRYQDWDGSSMRGRLRPEDRVDVPMVRIRVVGGDDVGGSGGGGGGGGGTTATAVPVVVDWNRAMNDLTGLGHSQVVGRPYAELIRDLPLSDTYRAAAIEHATAIGTEGGVTAGERSEEFNHPKGLEYVSESHREARETFPLPLPICRDGGGGGGDRERGRLWVELLVKRDRPKGPNAWHWRVLERPQIQPRTEDDCRFWLWGRVFTLRCSSKNVDNSAPTAAIRPSRFRPFHPRGELYLRPDDGRPTGLGAHIEACTTAGQIRFLLEALDILRRLTHVNMARWREVHEFTADWSADPDTRDIYRRFYEAAGGRHTLAESTVVVDRRTILCWKVKKYQRGWRDMVDAYSPLLAHICPRYPAGGIPLTMVPPPGPGATRLTVKIEVVDEEGCSRRNRHDDWEPSGAKWAVVEVPAWLNLNQLHRAVVMTMTGGEMAGGKCHAWSYMNPLAYRINAGGRNSRIRILDHTGDPIHCRESLRQRLAPDGAFVDHPCAFYRKQYGNGEEAVPTVCEHRYSVCCLLYRKGASIRLEDGFTRYGQDYMITLQKVSDKASRKNAPPVRCLRGKAFSADDRWSVRDANCMLEDDKYLRKNLSRDTDNESSLVLPWCHVQQKYKELVPLALSAVGADLQPAALEGEPPLPADGDEYRWYLMDDPEGIVGDGLRNYGVNELHTFRG